MTHLRCQITSTNDITINDKFSQERNFHFDEKRGKIVEKVVSQKQEVRSEVTTITASLQGARQTHTEAIFLSR